MNARAELAATGDLPDGYKATAFHPSLGGKGLQGRLRFQGGLLLFVSDSKRLDLPLDQLRLSSGGHNGEQIILQSRAVLDWTVYTAEVRFLQDPGLQGYSALKLQLQAVSRSRRSIPLPWVLAIGFFLVLMGGVVWLLFQRDLLVQKVVEKIPVEWEQQLGDTLFESVRAEGRLVENPEWQAQVNVVTSALLKGNRPGGHPFRFHIAKDTNLNAFAMPGGHIVIHSGLLASVKRPEELAGVLAHEMAHVAQRHGIRGVVESSGIYLLLQALVGDTSGLLGVVKDSSQFLLRQKFSRDFEHEADDLGWEYLVAARIDPRGMITFFKTLQAEALTKGATGLEAGTSWLSTHPTSKERIERLEARWRELEQRGAAFAPLGATP